MLKSCGSKVIDLCAGIGVLSFMHYHHQAHDRRPEITCIDINPAYVEVGKKVLPEVLLRALLMALLRAPLTAQVV